MFRINTFLDKKTINFVTRLSKNISVNSSSQCSHNLMTFHQKKNLPNKSLVLNHQPFSPLHSTACSYALKLNRKELFVEDDTPEKPIKLILGQSRPGVHFAPSFTNVLDVEDIQWHTLQPTKPGELVNIWLKLAKYRLTGLVALTTLAGFYMGSTTVDLSLMTYALLGTSLTSASAASLNQFLESPYDSQMIRTKNRPLVMQQVSPLHAFTFTCVSGITGISLLATMVNPLTAVLGATNLVLYSLVYTPMKRVHIANTWIGSVVGAIPPIMGFTAATGGIDFAALTLGLILYSWQFPHFNALSWNVKNDYARAGYRMMVVTHPEMCVMTAMRHSLFMLIYCEMMTSSFVGLTDKAFALTSLPINLYLIYLANKFRKEPNSQTSRKLFKYSLIHLPLLIALMVIYKKDKNKSETNDSTIKS